VTDLRADPVDGTPLSIPSFDRSGQFDGGVATARLPAALIDSFREAIDVGGVVVRAPGRVNLIGEHTDYNDGLAMPAAIDLATWVALRPRDDRTLSIRSVTLDLNASVDLAAPLVAASDWTDYVIGVAWALQQAGIPLAGASLSVYSELPLGAGLASSAALEVGVALALLVRAGVVMEPLAVARVCQQAENSFVGARCGLLDQIAVTHGRERHALLLDCRSLAIAPIPLPESVRLVLCNSMVTHAHTTGGFNRRRHECELAVERLRTRLPELRSLRDLTWHDFGELERILPEPLDRRVRHVLAENARVSEMALALTTRDDATIGRCMAASHASLRDLYEVSTPELDFLVDRASHQPGVIGTRMMGGGFGGCTISLVEVTNVEGFVNGVRKEYARKTAHVPDVFVCEPSDGAIAFTEAW
jgi:galactokinase